VDVESQPLRYFVAVAEELSYTRAAQRLRMSVPPLSRAIRRLESELGVRLFDRTTHSVTLTRPGTVLLDEAHIALDALDAAARRAQRAADRSPRLVLTLKADTDAGLLDPILARYAQDPAAIPVTVHLGRYGEQPAALRRGEADVALLVEPFDRTGLDAETVAVEPYVAALPSTHPLAARSEVTLYELGLPVRGRAGLFSMRRYLGETEPEIHDLPQLLALVERGELLAAIAEPLSRLYPRRGVAYRPVLDSPPWTLAIAWPEDSRSPAVAALVRAATSLASSERAGDAQAVALS
jgi:DNA-binding transcriptional LysR family regulator